MSVLEDRINALSCAVNMLEGTAGGFSSSDKMKHKMTLTNMLVELEQQYIKTKGGTNE